MLAIGLISNFRTLIPEYNPSLHNPYISESIYRCYYSYDYYSFH